jgi:tetratricopeptide (TPR) repeat protein
MTGRADPDALSLARQRVQAGDLAGAESICRQILDTGSDDADTRGLLGAACLSMGRLAEAAEHLARALHLNPGYAGAHANLGIVRAEEGALDEAVAHFRQALALNPLDAGTHARLADVLLRQDLPEDAAAGYRHAIRLAPDQARAHFGLGVTLARQGRWQEAEASYRQALRLKPDSAETHVNLGNVLVELGDLDGAIACHRKALAIRPDFAQAHINLGRALTWRRKPGEAIASLEEALRLRPESTEAHNNMGVALAALGRYGESAASYRRALRLRPDSPEVHDNLGALALKQNRLDEAVDYFERALTLNPDLADAHLHLALGRLIAGDFERGWPEFEWRWRSRGFRPRQLPRPLWDGSPLAHRTILLYAEQGVGDTLQFIRYAPLLKERGATVILECQKSLVRIMGSCPGIDRIVPRGDDLPDYDVQSPLLSLPGILRTTLATVPANVPYLFADPRLADRWRGVLSVARDLKMSGVEIRGLKIGIAWQGNPSYADDTRRSIPLARFAPLARVPGVRLYSLQKMWGTDQLAGIADQFGVTDFGDELDEASGPFMDTAAIMTSLNLVVTSDTAIPHLAGALGVPVWVALSTAADFRYLLDRQDSPWYPTMRLFRQSEPGNWDAVFERIADELRRDQPGEPA